MYQFVKKTGLVILSMLVFLAGLSLYFYFNNFHTVIQKQVYRSRELTKSEFITLVDQFHIRSILNLRGAHPNKSWYQQEMAAVSITKVQHYDIALESKHLPNPKTLQQLVTILETAPRPLLIHCQSGVDRTGFASALVLILANNHSMPVIEQQVSPEYFVFTNSSIGRQFLQEYKLWLQQHHLITSRDNFLLWLREEG